MEKGLETQGKEDYEFFGPQRIKKKHEVIRENEDKNKEKKPRKDEGQKTEREGRLKNEENSKTSEEEVKARRCASSVRKTRRKKSKLEES